MCPLMRAPRITPLMRAYWRHLVNTNKLVLPSAHPTPQLKRKINQFSHFCTAHSIVLSGMHGHVLSPNNGHVLSPNNCPFARGIWAPSNTFSWPHPSSAQINTCYKRCFDQFSHVCTAHDRVSQYFATGRLLSPYNYPFPRGIWFPI